MKKILYILFGVVFIWLFLFGVKPVSAASTNLDGTTDSDGITWSTTTKSIPQVMKLSNSVSLGYTIGYAGNPGGAIDMSGDSHILDTSSGINDIYSKMNTFLVDNGKYISTSSQRASGWSYGNVSPTSPQFMVVDADNSSGTLPVLFANTSSYLKDKAFYQGTIPDTSIKAYKLTGDFEGSNLKLAVELTIKPVAPNVPIIERRMKITNITSSPEKPTVYFGDDTGLNATSADNVTFYSLGVGKGFYFNHNSYGLYINADIPNGPDSYLTKKYENGNTTWASSLLSGPGQEADTSLTTGELMGKSVDSAYTLKWNGKTLQPGESATYSTTIGTSKNNYILPVQSKTYVNKTHPNVAVNKIGDKLEFHLKMSNNGYNSSMNLNEIKDAMPEGIELDADDSAHYIVYDKTGNQVSDTAVTLGSDGANYFYQPKTKLAYLASAELVIPVKITNAAGGDSGTIIRTNKATFDVVDNNNSNNDSSPIARVDIPIEKKQVDEVPDFHYSFKYDARVLNNSELNQTDPAEISQDSADYSDNIEAPIGSTIRFRYTYTIYKDSKERLTGGYIQAQVDSNNFTVVPINGHNGVVSYSNGIPKLGNPLNHGPMALQSTVQDNTVHGWLDVLVTSKQEIEKIAQNAKMVNVDLNWGTAHADLVSNDVNIKVTQSSGFVQVPDLIDFGVINYFSQNRKRENVNTEGKLIVNHPDYNDFNVSVSYEAGKELAQREATSDGSLGDVIGDTDEEKDGNTLKAPAGQNLLEYKQKDAGSSSDGTWKALDSSGVKLRATDFSGNAIDQDLTDYVKAGNFLLRINNTVKNGKYTGQLVWTMTDSL